MFYKNKKYTKIYLSLYCNAKEKLETDKILKFIIGRVLKIREKAKIVCDK